MKALMVLRLLVSFRAYRRSKAMKLGGLVGVLGALQTWFGTQDGAALLEWLAGLLGVMPATASGIVLMLVGLAVNIVRALTERGLLDKVIEDEPATQT